MESKLSSYTRMLMLLLVLASLNAEGDDTEALAFLPEDLAAPQAPIFTAPVPVTNTTGTTHYRDLLFALFRPTRRPHWQGNIKRYRLGIQQSQAGAELVLYDALGALALDPDTGIFKPDTTSVWTPQRFGPDGADIASGGLASRLYAYQSGAPVASSRKVFTYTGLSLDLTHPSNAIHESNIADGIDPTKMLNKTLLAADDLNDIEFYELIQWARGVDVDDYDGNGERGEGRLDMGAPLHNPPLVVNINTPDNGHQNLLFAVTNAGYLHTAVMDTDNENTPLEQFAFIPPDLLANLKRLKINQAGTGDASSEHTLAYGLDGGLTAWFQDQQHDGVLDAQDDHLYLYFGQRRGGRHYYALDVTDMTAPKLLWSVRGGVGGLLELGQTWSRPVYARVALRLAGDNDAKLRDVLIFGGGYDTQHDQAGLPRRIDTVGRAIYILDARSGAVLWWAGPAGHPGDPDLAFSDMRYAIAAPVTVVDRDGDGQVDLITVGDLGGQLWRFDIVDGIIHGGVIADLQDPGDGTSDVTNNRRIFEAVDVARMRSPVFGNYLAFAVASGYRPHPLDKATHETAFMLRQHDSIAPQAGPASYQKRHAGELLDITQQPNLDADELSAEEITQYANGWRLSLRDTTTYDFVGEKVLSAPLLAGGLFLFTTYTPDPQPGPYGPGPGRSRLYAINIENGTPRQIPQTSGSEIGRLEVEDRFEDLPTSGPPPAPVVVFPPFDALDPVVLVGTEISDITFPYTMRRSFWYQDHVH